MKVYAVLFTIADVDTECHTQEILGIFTTKEKAETAQIAINSDGKRHSRISVLDLNVAKAHSESDAKRLKLAKIRANYKHEYECEAVNAELNYKVDIM